MSYGIPILGEKEHQLKNINLEIGDGASIFILGLVRWKKEILTSYDARACRPVRTMDGIICMHDLP